MVLQQHWIQRSFARVSGLSGASLSLWSPASLSAAAPSELKGKNDH